MSAPDRGIVTTQRERRQAGADASVLESHHHPALLKMAVLFFGAESWYNGFYFDLAANTPTPTAIRITSIKWLLFLRSPTARQFFTRFDALLTLDKGDKFVGSEGRCFRGSSGRC